MPKLSALYHFKFTPVYSKIHHLNFGDAGREFIFASQPHRHTPKDFDFGYQLKAEDLLC